MKSIFYVAMVFLLLLSAPGFSATRFYLPTTSETPAIFPTFESGWTVTNEAERGRLATNKIFSPLTAKITAPVSSGLVLVRQFISDPIGPQTISGTVSGELLCSAESGGQSYSAIAIKVVSGVGAMRGVLLALTSENLTATYRYPNGWANMETPSIRTLSTVEAQNGDRIVVEIGYNSKAASKLTGQMFGDNAAIDLPLGNNTGGTTTMEGWLEFSGNLFSNSPRVTVDD